MWAGPSGREVAESYGRPGVPPTSISDGDSVRRVDVALAAEHKKAARLLGRL
jgi:hypothetical protein